MSECVCVSECVSNRSTRTKGGEVAHACERSHSETESGTLVEKEKYEYTAVDDRQERSE